MPAEAASDGGSSSSSSSSNLWRSLLQEAAAARPPRLPNGHVLFLGDPAAGKTRLVQRFCAAAAGGSAPEEEGTEEPEAKAWSEGEGEEDDNGGSIAVLPREVRTCAWARTPVQFDCGCDGRRGRWTNEWNLTRQPHKTMRYQNHGRPLLSYSFFDAVDPGEDEADEEAGGGASASASAAASRKTSSSNEDEATTAARVNVWSLSDPAYRGLLPAVLSPPTGSSTGSSTTGSSSAADEDDEAAAACWQALGRTVCLLGLDLTRPWTFERALTRWLAVLRAALETAALAAAKGDAAAAEAGLERLRRRQAAYLANCYNGGGGSSSSSSSVGKKTTKEEGGAESEEQEGSFFSVRAAPLSSSNNDTPLKSSQRAAARGSAAAVVLPEGVLVENLGVPLIVVGLKADLVQARVGVLFTDSFLVFCCLGGRGVVVRRVFGACMS